ncbi:hypothetical protein L9F63_018706, partial [Diploptera punctata]
SRGKFCGMFSPILPLERAFRYSCCSSLGSRGPDILRFLPRESGKMLWGVFAFSPTGGSRYYSCFSLGSLGK